MSRRNSVSTIFHVACLTAMATLPFAALADNPMVVHDVKHDLSRTLRDMPASAHSVQSAAQQPPFPQKTGPAITTSQPDPVSQTPSGAPVNVHVGLNFDGLSAADTVASGGPFGPPDTNGAVGPRQFVEWVNVTIEGFDRTTRTAILGPTPGNAF